MHWVLGRPGVFLNTVGDITLLPKVLDAASRYATRPTDEQMDELAARRHLVPLFLTSNVEPSMAGGATRRTPRRWASDQTPSDMPAGSSKSSVAVQLARRFSASSDFDPGSAV